MQRFLLGAVWATLLCGCEERQLTLAGGKPIAYWVEAVQSPDAKLRKTAVFKLGNVGSTDPAAFPTVSGALKDPDTRVRSEAILAVVKFGPQAQEAVPILRELSRHDRDAKVRSYAARALEKLRSDSGLSKD